VLIGTGAAGRKTTAVTRTSGISLPVWAALAVVAGLVVPAPASASAASGPCRLVPCRVELLVGPDPVAFRSDERFSTTADAVSVRLFAAGVEMRTISRDGPGSCRRHLRGPGFVATAAVCGTQAPVAVRARRTWGGLAQLAILYRARSRPAQGVLGISAGSGGGIGAPVGGGLPGQ
jgi:hypothetical protein